MRKDKQFTPREGGKAKPAPEPLSKPAPAAPEQPTDQQEGK